jgi:rhodanese-related sulfurtransferase
MPTLNLADRYRAVGLKPGADILALRQAPFIKLSEKIDPRSAIELTRLYFGLQSPAGTEWFREPFHSADPSFSMVDNKREVAVLAACLLDVGFEDGETVCGLAPLATAAAGARHPAAAPELLSELEHGLAVEAINARQRRHGDPNAIKLPAKSKLPAEQAAFAESISNDFSKIAGFFKQISDESIEATKTLATQVANIIKPLHADVVDLREEVEILWWHIGGWSKLVHMPFSELPSGTAAALAGLDLAELSRTLVGPAAAPALIQRTLGAGRKGKLGRSTLKQAIDGLPDGALDKLLPAEGLGDLPDVCPVLTAFAKARESGPGTAWHAAFRKSTGLTEETGFRTLDLAMQVFRERMILYALK